MHAYAKVKKPDDIEFSITLTAKLSEWKELRAQMPGAWPAWQVSESISSAISQAEKHFYADPAKEEAK